MTPLLVVWTFVVVVGGYLAGRARGKAIGQANAARFTLTERLTLPTRNAFALFCSQRYTSATANGPSPLGCIEAVQAIALEYLKADVATAELGPVPEGRPSYTIAEGR